jgi:hypothetical protein
MIAATGCRAGGHKSGDGGDHIDSGVDDFFKADLLLFGGFFGKIHFLTVQIAYLALNARLATLTSLT